MDSYPQILLTGPAQRDSIPRWLGPFDAKIVRVHAFTRARRLPELTVVRARALDSVFKETKFLKILSTSFDSSREPSKLVFVFDQPHSSDDLPELARLLTSFRRSWDLEFTESGDEARQELREAFAKILAIRHRAPHSAADADPLGEVKEILAATRDLRSASGRLAADRVAGVFGLLVTQLASALGKSRQSVFKTPDSETLQEPLRPFERAARLRAVLSDEDFRHWLKLANDQLENRAPVDLIREGRVSVIADLAEDMLTGSPT